MDFILFSASLGLELLTPYKVSHSSKLAHSYEVYGMVCLQPLSKSKNTKYHYIELTFVAREDANFKLVHGQIKACGRLTAPEDSYGLKHNEPCRVWGLIKQSLCGYCYVMNNSSYPLQQFHSMRCC